MSHARTPRPRLLALCLALLATIAVGQATARPTIWMFPPPDMDGVSLRALFEQPQAWSQARRRIDGLGYADHWLNSQFSDAELRSWFALLRQWHLRLGLEVGALKVWGTTADAAFAADRRKWDRFVADGAHINSIAMDEPFAFSRRKLQATMEFAADQTARFIGLVRQSYPSAQIGDIEPYPGIQSDDLLSFIDAVQSRLRQQGARGMDFFRLDVDWMHFRPGDTAGTRGWEGVRDIEAQCHRRGIPFSLIYWAADFPSLNRAGLATEQSWEDAILRQGAAYAATGGIPDEMVIESWVHTPKSSVPENEPGTFAHSVLDFTGRFGTTGAR